MKKFYPVNVKLKIYQMSDMIDRHVTFNTPFISQMPESPRGCKVTSLDMLLGFAGKRVDKMTLAKEIKKDSTLFTKKKRHVSFSNPNTGFVGDMYSLNRPGFGVFYGAIFALAKSYLSVAIDISSMNS